MTNDEQFMALALACAKQAQSEGEVPVGAVVVHDGVVIGKGSNAPISRHDPSAHAEIIALRDAALREQNYRLTGATMYITLEPCAMCVGAMIHARIERVVFAAREPKAGMLVSHTALLDSACFNHQLTIEEGVLADECSQLLSDFFKQRRREAKMRS